MAAPVSGPRTRRSREGARPPGRIVALAVFALLVTAAPLAFGAVDQLTQIVAAAVFAVGVIAHPPQIGRLGRNANRLVIAAVLILVVKELAPAAWFGSAEWRTTLTEGYQLALPWTHHPEPGRAVDVWLAGAVAVVWFLWVRTLASERADRPVLAWSLFLGVVVVAVVSFATRGKDPEAIYGWRFTPGWIGFGPFPNRNHSACLFAMGAVMGAGCIAWAGARRKFVTLLASVPAVALVFVALLETRSRGGFVALGVGLALFLGLTLLKLRDRRALAVIVGAVLLIGSMSLIFGAQTLARFSKKDGSGEISTNTRLAVWKDAVAMWRDARLLGHGAGSFASLFPMYQHLELEMQSVVHPESSWLQWLVEFGLIPVALGAVGLVVVLARALREAFASESGFFLRTAGIATTCGLLAHAAVDVPAHRWGTAGFALAALALACPRPRGRAPEVRSRKAALVPLGAAAFWVLPFFYDAPMWSPLELDRLVEREMTTGRVPFATLERAARCFPLNPALHESLGLRLTDDPREAARWQRHFRIATRLVPASWALPRQQARACAPFAPSLALHYWQLVVERGGHRSEELFADALHQSAALPNAAAAWESYVEAHPELALVYATTLPEADGRRFFELWWRERALADVALRDREKADFYALAARWSGPERFAEWMAHRTELKPADFRKWAALLHAWNDDAAAWKLLSEMVAEPEYPALPPRLTRSDAEQRWRTDPADLINARHLAHLLADAGDADAAREIILIVARRDKAPSWFLRKSAYTLVAHDELPGGVAMLLRDSGG